MFTMIDKADDEVGVRESSRCLLRLDLILPTKLEDLDTRTLAKKVATLQNVVEKHLPDHLKVCVPAALPVSVVVLVASAAREITSLP